MSFFNENTPFDKFFQSSSVDQRSNIGEQFQTFFQHHNQFSDEHKIIQQTTSSLLSKPQGQGNKVVQLPKGTPNLPSFMPPTNIFNLQNNNSEQNKQSLHRKKPLKRKTNQTDRQKPRKKKKRNKTVKNQGQSDRGYEINVYNNGAKSYSISDGNYDRKHDANSFGNTHQWQQQPGRQHGQPQRHVKRNTASQRGLRTNSELGPWPNDKHWNNQAYDSRELGESIPFLF